MPTAFIEVRKSGIAHVSTERKSLHRQFGPMILRSATVAKMDPSAEERGTRNPEESAISSPVLRFGAFEVNLEFQELRKHGMRMRLEEKPFQILQALLKRPGGLVSRSELRAKLWPDTFVSYDHSLNTAVSKLRSALGETSKIFRYVETVPRRGYRFVGAVENPTPALPGTRRRALLVLPFRNRCSSRASESFCDGLTEELSAEIARLDPERLGVIAVTTAVLYKGADLGIDQIGRKAGAGLVVEGSVRRNGHRVRVSIQLVQVCDQTHLWSEIYERPVTSPFAVQAEIAQLAARDLANALGLDASEGLGQKSGVLGFRSPRRIN